MKVQALQIRNLIFGAVIAVFAVFMAFILTHSRCGGHRLFVFVSLFITFGILSAGLVVFTVLAKETGIRKFFFILTGASGAGVMIFGLLHNIVYILCVKLGWVYWGEGGDEPVFFILVLFVCFPLFILSLLGSIVLVISSRLKKTVYNAK
jgi:hypothetical protein